MKVANQTGSSVGNVFMDVIAPKAGLRKGDFQEVRMDVNNMVAAMAAKTVDAMVNVEPYNAIAVAEGIGISIMDFSSVDRMPVFMAATPDFVAKSPDTIIAYLKCWQDVARDFKDDPGKVADVIYSFFTSKGYAMSRETFVTALARVEVSPGFPGRPGAGAAAGRRDPAARTEDHRHSGLEEGAAARPVGKGECVTVGRNSAAIVRASAEGPGGSRAQAPDPPYSLACRIRNALKERRTIYPRAWRSESGEEAREQGVQKIGKAAGEEVGQEGREKDSEEGRRSEAGTKPAAKKAPKSAPTAAKTTAPQSNGGPITWNFKLLSHHMLDGFGGMGEGMSIQIAPDGRRILWLAHESAPKNFTAVDVSDPRKPKVVVQTDLPQAHMRSNSLETCGNIMAVAYQTQKKGLQPAGMELFDISVPEKPRSISFFDCSGPTSRGVHQLWFCDGEYVHCASGAPDFKPTHPSDDQFYRCIDVRNPSKPVEIGRWHMPGHQAGRQRDAAAAPSARQGLPRPQLQRLSAAPGPLLSRLYRRRHVRPRHLRQGRIRRRSRSGPTRRPIPVSCIRWCRCSTAA